MVAGYMLRGEVFFPGPRCHRLEGQLSNIPEIAKGTLKCSSASFRH